MYYKIASILLNNEQKAGVASDIFIAQPDNQKEALVGKLFVMAEIQTSDSDSAMILEFLIKNINFNYYQNEKVILKERIETISIESIFESALTKTNKDLAEFITQEKLKISPYAFNVSICVLFKSEIYFSGAGKNKTLLIYKEKTSLKLKEREDDEELEQIEYKISDVGDAPETEALNINKLFSNVVSGKIPVGGYFLVINEALSEYLSNKQLIRIITKLSPAGAAEQIRNLLEQINSYVSFLGIIIKNTVATSMSGEELKSQLEEEIKIDDYKPEITRTEEKTEEIMTPAGVVNLKKWTKAITDKMKPVQMPAAPKETKPSRGMFLLKEKIFFKKRGGIISPEKTKDFFKKLGKLIGAIFGFIINIFHRESDNEPYAAEPAPKTEEKTPTVISGKKIKIILVIALICLAGFFINLSVTNQRNKDNAKLRDFNSLISSISGNQDKIDADFVYGNKTDAKQLYDLNKDLLASIPATEVSKRQTVQALFDREKAELLKIQNINNISGLTKIADFSNLTATADPQNLLLVNTIAYANDNKNNAIFKIDVKQNIVTAHYSTSTATSGPITLPTAGQDSNVFYLSGNNILQLDKTDQTSIIKIALPSTPENISGLQGYSDKIYILDKTLNQIFRYTRSSNSFVNQYKWLSQETNLASSTGLFIDDNGNLFILYNNGRVEKYLKGKKQDLTLESVDPAITSASRLIATADYFYILEPAAKRLVIWNNKGVYLAQYIFTDLNNVKDFAVNDKDKQIYILAGSAVYQMAIPTLK
jgi:hypothetical protein